MSGSCLIQVLTLTAVVLTQQAPQLQDSAQYHIQTDQGSDRFFRYQTHTGQYRKEIRHDDGSQEGTYGWVDPTGVLRLFDFIADNQGYRIVQESLYKVGPPNPSYSLQTRGGEINLGFEVYPLDGSAPLGRLGGSSSLPATKLHLADGDFRNTGGYSVNALISSLPHEVHPNPLGKQIGATFFTGKPAPPAPVVVGAEAVALSTLQPEKDAFVVGHTAQAVPSPRAPAARTGIVIGLSHNEPEHHSAPVQPAQRPRTLPAQAPRRAPIVIGSTRRKRFLQ